MKKKIARGILVGGLAFILAFAASSSHLLRPLEWKSWDMRLRLLADRSRANQDIVIILIDQYSLDLYEKEQSLSWPWPRQMYSALLDYLKKGGAKACFIDLIFSEQSVYGIEDDQNLAEAIARTGNVFLPIALSQKEEAIEEVDKETLRRFALQEENLPAKAVFAAKSAKLPVSSLLHAAKGVGNSLFVSDDDGIFRRLPLLFSYRDILLPSLPLAVSRFIKGGREVAAIPLDETGRMIIRYHGPAGTYRTYSAAAIINSWAQIEAGKEPQIPLQDFVGKIVLVGGSAPGILDLRPTPLSAVNPGVEIQATVIDNILHENFIRIPARLFLAVLIGVFALFTAIGVSILKKTGWIAAFFILCLLLPFAAAWAAFSAGAWLEFVAPESAVLLSFIGSALLKYRTEGKQRRFIKNVFRHYLSPDVIERIIANPSLLRLGGEKREITAFFSDVAGFTAISESLSPEELVNLLNAYLTEITNIILSYGGTLDKYEGDAVIAFWNAPLDQPDHAARACRAALECQKRLAELRPVFRERYGHEVFMRIGLNSGPAVVGNMGSNRRFDYTAMGDTMNLASRLEGACKQYKISILAGEETYSLVKEAIATRQVDIIRVVGKKKPVAAYEIIGGKESMSSIELEKIKKYEEALRAYRQREWEKARRLFEEIEDDPVALLYAERCRSLEQSPPPSEWDGVFSLKEK